MTELSALQVAALVVAAVGVGFAKTAIGGVASVSVALFAAVLPARESTGALLPLLIVADVVAVSVYRQHANWPTLLRLFPSVAAGVVAGAVFVARVGDVGMRRTIGIILLVLVAVHLWQRWRKRDKDPESLRAEQHRRRHASAFVFGILAGFTTMVANSGGPVMSIYLLSAGMGMLGFLGTSAWFFFAVNVFKVPFSAGLNLITAESLLLNAWLVPAVLVGAFAGRAVIGRIDQSRFETLVLVFVVVSSLSLVR
ncbi:MAG TPA: sulfite exporter TauE/SafE family protein [Egibacteraceae bacterium]|nr:sulfite exporter TauE/SafE family protein [Egibacteraceae bacterium]